MRICICDTDNSVCNELIKNISDSFLSEEAFSVRCFFSAEELLEIVKEKNIFDVYLLNADINGIITAEIIRRNNRNAIIILFADSEKYIYDAFKVEALYYLKTPIDPEEFSELFKRMLIKYRNRNSFLYLRWKNERYSLKISDIIYIESYNRHLTFYTKDGEYSSVGKIQNVFEKLSFHGFLRIHQGYTVNMNHIKNFGTHEVEMSDGTKVMISSRRRADALNTYDSFLQQNT